MDERNQFGRFNQDFKRSIVLAIESGERDISEVENTYGIKGHSTILRWCRRYGGNHYPVMTRENNGVSPIPKEEETLLLRNRIKELERALKEAQLKQATFETLIDIADRYYSIDIKKNIGGKRSTK